MGELSKLGLRLIPAHEADVPALLSFELGHRMFFQQWIPDRGNDYYSPDEVAASLVQARRWWEAGTDALHVVVTPDDQVVARANLVDIREHRAELGYRVAETHLRRGIATAAVRDLLTRAPGWHIRRVFAVTRVDHAGSGRVLERCGFEVIGRRPGALHLGEAAHDALDWVVAAPGADAPSLSFGYAGDEGLGDRLLAAALRGDKTATTSLAVEYRTGDALYEVGDRLVLRDHAGTPRGRIEITDVSIVPLDRIGDDVARAEGEDYTDVAGWRAAHIPLWEQLTSEIRRDAADPTWELSETEPVVVLRFRLLKPESGDSGG